MPEEISILVLDGSENFCDKCGEVVAPDNDIRELETRARNNAVFLFMRARHCIPVVRDGVTVCEGSPSRAQYLNGQPRDARAAYPYIPEDEKMYRDAWQLLQAEYH